ncbi:MAG: exopolyphosphatase [Deltaproteobacteria bacterium]|nr:exopolyphosphatase [Deltaproteobacteria bacterium]
MKLLTRSDFDGLACAVLLVEKGVVDEYEFVHPKDIQDGQVKITQNDVLANVPFAEGCGLWFDHHSSEEDRLEMGKLEFEGLSKSAPSAAQVIWEYYGGEKTFGPHFLPLLDAVNKADSANLTREEVLDAKGWILLAFIMDPRTGLGRFRDYRISNYQLMQDLIQHCRTKKVEEILDLEDVKERTKRYFEQQELFKDMLKRCCTIKENLIISDLSEENTIYCGNRFLVFALYPQQNIELRIMQGKDKQNMVFTCGHSIINKTSKTNVGKLMLKYNGGGHDKVGTCQVSHDGYQKALQEITETIIKDG